jgi:hypothetical protein
MRSSNFLLCPQEMSFSCQQFASVLGKNDCGCTSWHSSMFTKLLNKKKRKKEKERKPTHNSNNFCHSNVNK